MAVEAEDSQVIFVEIDLMVMYIDVFNQLRSVTSHALETSAPAEL